jgi:WW domain
MSSSTPPLPPGWTLAVDPSSGRTYYANATTGESSWVPPSWPPPAPHTPRFVPPPQSPIAPPLQQQWNTEGHQNQPFEVSRHVSTTTPGTQVSIAASVAALASSGLLVPAARAVVDYNSNSSEEERKLLELHGLSAGQLADLCAIQREELAEKGADFKPYTPIAPYALSNTAKRPPMEPGRLEIRIHSLYTQLRKLHE